MTVISTNWNVLQYFVTLHDLVVWEEDKEEEEEKEKKEEEE